jgi:hypothetical protein
MGSSTSSPCPAQSRYSCTSLNQWQALNEYTRDGNLPISNCLCEQSFKAVATGRKNWLFVGSEGGSNAAILFSIVLSCRRIDLDPYAYLDDILRRVNTHPASRIDELLPDHWLAVGSPQSRRTRRQRAPGRSSPSASSQLSPAVNRTCLGYERLPWVRRTLTNNQRKFVKQIPGINNDFPQSPLSLTRPPHQQGKALALASLLDQ